MELARILAYRWRDRAPNGSIPELRFCAMRLGIRGSRGRRFATRRPNSALRQARSPCEAQVLPPLRYFGHTGQRRIQAELARLEFKVSARPTAVAEQCPRRHLLPLKIREPGVYFGLPSVDYHSDPSLGASDLKPLLRPWHAALCDWHSISSKFPARLEAATPTAWWSPLDIDKKTHCGRAEVEWLAPGTTRVHVGR